MATNRKKSGKSGSTTAGEQLEQLAKEAVATARTAKRHRKPLGGDNFYGNKLASFRADATNVFGRLAAPSISEASVVEELVQKVFAAETSPKDRADAARELSFRLKTKWATATPDNAHLEHGGIFPLVTLEKTQRSSFVAIGRQVNGSYASGWFDACAVMMRRLLETSIIEAFEARQLAANIKDGGGDFLQLTGLINKALAEPSWNLPRNVRRELPNLRDLGHRSAHNRYYVATKSDVDANVGAFRETVEAFLHLAHLL